MINKPLKALAKSPKEVIKYINSMEDQAEILRIIEFAVDNGHHVYRSNGLWYAKHDDFHLGLLFWYKNKIYKEDFK